MTTKDLMQLQDLLVEYVDDGHDSAREVLNQVRRDVDDNGPDED